jgi:hypothetical protein
MMESRGNSSGATVPGLDTLGIYPENVDSSDVIELVILLKATVVNTNKQWAQQISDSRYNYSLVSNYYHARPYFLSVGSKKQVHKDNDRELAAVNKSMGRANSPHNNV